MVTRRDVLVGSGAIAAASLLWPNSSLAAVRPRELIAKPGQARLMGSQEPATPIWGYDGRVPGPTLRTKQGEEFAVDLVNELPQPTTIHWHGVRINNAMDGVAGLTQKPVAPGDRFAYRFTPPDAGTYWYHPHNRTWEQLARGLQGPLIVEEANAPSVDQDIALVIDDWRLDRDGKIHERSFGSMHDVTHAGRLGNVLTLNGKDNLDLQVQAGERLRLRLI
ncbi:MAG: multicopper oxidase domain-containing protein, partial [Pseudomonadota bacterium]